jgi:tetratricopeptide (TPR) repeat protein
MTLGLKYRIEGNNKAAIECWNLIFYHEIDFRRHEICSIIEDTWRFYALAQETEGDLRESIEAWKHYITLIELSMTEIYRDQMQDASYNISLCYYYTGCYAEAEYFLGKMMALINRTDLIRTNNALNLKAYLCSKKGKYDDAIKYHRDVLENIKDQDNINKPLSDYVNASIACNYADNNNPETALITIKNVTTNTADPYILDMYGYVYYKLKHYDEAIKYFDRALEAVNDDRLKSEIFFHKGNTLLQQKKYSDSRILYDNSSTINPSKSKAYNNKAVAYAYEKDLDNALEQLKKALTKEPSSTTVIENLAKSYSAGSTTRTFWDYWMSSTSKKTISIGIIILIVGILSVNIFIPALLGAIEKRQQKRLETLI